MWCCLVAFTLKWHSGQLLGNLLDSSGWTTALCEAGIATTGTADSFLKASHLTRTRHSHQVTVLALSKLQHEAWEVTIVWILLTNGERAWQRSVPFSNSGKLSVNLKFLSASSFELIATETSTYLWNPWKHYYHGSLPLTIQTMLCGFLFISEI